jgi:hypothetical protein
MLERLLRLKLALALVVVGLVACEGEMTAREDGSETHFLSGCVETCGAGFECLCGVCTEICAADATCAGLAAGAACVPVGPRVADGSCEDQGASAFCDVPCTSQEDCSGFAEPAHCDGGYCRRGEAPAPSCQRSDLMGTTVAVLGDALLELSPFTSHLEDLARAEGSLAPEGNFRHYATHLNSFLAGDTLSFSVQYDTARAEGPIRVLVMNGGETDMMQGTCGATPQSDCAAVQAAATGLRELLARMAADGVREVVYLFYADPVDRPMIKAGLDVLRPLAESTCRGAPLSCHFIDLRPVFADHYGEYVSTDGLVFSDAGARASAESVWQLMQNECVAW